LLWEMKMFGGQASQGWSFNSFDGHPAHSSMFHATLQ
jgi:hypothetical protein